MKELSEYVYQRKSVRRYSETKLTEEELEKVKSYISQLKPLIPEIKTSFEIVPCKDTNCGFNAEYCLLAYGEPSNLWLTNIGYMLEQLDLYLVSLGIGACWFGMGKVEERVKDGLEFAIMMSFGKYDGETRKSADDFSRDDADDFWSGMSDAKLGEIVRLAPSAVNSQPWRVEQIDNKLAVYRQKGKIPILSANLYKHFNKIDMGIFLCYLDIALENEGYAFTRVLGTESDEGKRVLVATYEINKQ